MAGIPAASLVAIAIILPAVGLPVEAIGVVWVTDRMLDMCRTAVNVFSDTVGAVVIARSPEAPYGRLKRTADTLIFEFHHIPCWTLGTESWRLAA